MGSALFHASLDWNHAVSESIRWILIAWLISAICTLAGACLIRFTTEWGRQFWAITASYFTGIKSIKVWAVLGILLFSIITAVRLNILFSYQGNDMFTAIQAAVRGMASNNQELKNSGIHGFWVSIKIFCTMAVIHIVRAMADIYITQHFIVNWRKWLTGHLTDDWLMTRAYYRSHFVAAQFNHESATTKQMIENSIDNPDQRIQQDIDIFTTGIGDAPNTPNIGTGNILLFGAVEAIVSLISFAVILWNLSATFPLFGMRIPRAMFWIVIAYVLVATFIAFKIGRPLIRLSFKNELTNAAFRYGLVRIRDAAEAIAFYRGERAERAYLHQRFDDIVKNYYHFVNQTISLTAWNLSASQAIVPLPWLIQAPRLFTGVIELGDVTQTGSAFTHVQNGLSFFRNIYDDFAGYRAVIMRLYGLVTVNTKTHQLPQMTILPHQNQGMLFDHISVSTPLNTVLIDDLTVQLNPGDRLMITGQSGSGKTTLFRSIAQLWPYCQGNVSIFCNNDEMMFLSQMPYLPLGNLRQVICYPLDPATVNDVHLINILNTVLLSHLTTKLNQTDDWARVLSPGEQQRIAFARILLAQPKIVFLDESTSALDEGLELALYQLLDTTYPKMIIVSISHRPSLRNYHDHELQIQESGQWELTRI